MGDDMKNQLIQDINQYISYLKQMGFFISVHGKGIGGLLENNIHTNPFCLLIKTDPEAWQKCIRCQKKVYASYQKGQLFGMCHAGVEEYVFFVSDKTFVSVSGYGIHQEQAHTRLHRISQDFCLEYDELCLVYENGLKHETEDVEALTVLVKPLCHMLYLLQLLLVEIPETETKSTLFDALLAFVQHHFMDDITIRDIAEACACSVSTVCHLFKQHTGLSIKKYISFLRIKQAKKFLTTSDMPIGTVALMCGFSNINYFATAFKKHTGMTPTDYRFKSPAIHREAFS